MRAARKIACVLLILIFTAAYPMYAAASGESVLLSENGVDVLVHLPPGAVLDTQTFPHHSILSMDELQVVLEIGETSVEKQLKFEKEIYESFEKDEPETTDFEVLPEFTTDMGTFTVCRLVYKDHNDRQATSLQAFCKLNYKYIYSITLREAGEIDASLIRQFANCTVTKTPLTFDMTVVGFLVFYAALGLIVILNTFRIKHFRTKTTAVITGFRRGGRRTFYIQLSYYLEYGGDVSGEYSTTALGVARFAKNKGKEVEITYSEKRPQRVHLVASKMGYIVGMAFIILAAMFAYLMIF